MTSRWRIPWPGPRGDEWDSPGYHDFWDRIEQATNKQLRDEREQTAALIEAPPPVVQAVAQLLTN